MSTISSKQNSPHKAASPPIRPIAPTAHPAIVFCAAAALLLVEDTVALEVPEALVSLLVPFGEPPPMKLAVTPVLFWQWLL